MKINPELFVMMVSINSLPKPLATNYTALTQPFYHGADRTNVTTKISGLMMWFVKEKKVDFLNVRIQIGANIIVTGKPNAYKYIALETGLNQKDKNNT
jgi:hypothetical protein